jgi:hypothetical protein
VHKSSYLVNSLYGLKVIFTGSTGNIVENKRSKFLGILLTYSGINYTEFELCVTKLITIN